MHMLRKGLLIIGIGVALFALYVGSYAPFEKSRQFIQAYRALSSPETKRIEDFKAVFDRALDYPSPVGQAEEVRFMTNEIGNIVRRNPPEWAARALIEYAEGRYQELIARNPRVNTTQLMLFLGQAWEEFGVTYRDAASLGKAEAYYVQGLARSPRRPQFLYGLYSVYRERGENSKALEVLQEILTYWPENLPVQ